MSGSRGGWMLFFVRICTNPDNVMRPKAWPQARNITPQLLAKVEEIGVKKTEEKQPVMYNQ